MLKRLVKLANKLDQKGLHKEASVLDKILHALAEPEDRPDIAPDPMGEVSDDPRTHPYKETYKGPAGVPLADPRKPSQDARSLYDEVEPYDLYPEDDDYDPDEMERRENMPSREEFAQLFR